MRGLHSDYQPFIWNKKKQQFWQWQVPQRAVLPLACKYSIQPQGGRFFKLFIFLNKLQDLVHPASFPSRRAGHFCFKCCPRKLSDVRWFENREKQRKKGLYGDLHDNHVCTNDLETMTTGTRWITNTSFLSGQFNTVALGCGFDLTKKKKDLMTQKTGHK